MRVEVLFFAVLRERIRRPGETLELEPHADVGAARAAIAARHPEIAPLLPVVQTAVNRAFANDDQLLREGDELALIPPVAGGSGSRSVPTDRLSRPLRDLRISVTDRCNFRCPYCMPQQTYDDRYQFLKASDQLDFDEIVRVVRLFASLGVRKLRLTGGEPLLRPNLATLVAKLAAIAGIEDIALTTNGVLLERHVCELKDAGLHRATVSLDSLDPDVFARMSGGFSRVADVLAGIGAAGRAGLTPIKVNAVVQRDNNERRVLDLLEHFRGTGVIVRFIEFMDVGTLNGWRPERVVPSAEIFARVDERWPLVPLAPSYRGEVAARYAFADGAGEVGFISSVTQPFCGDCSRARLSSDGTLFTCLFATHGTRLRDALRAGATDERLTALICDAWSGRDDRYSELRADAGRGRSALRNIEMHYIGG